MVSSFQRRRIRVTFQIATGTFLREGDPDTVVLEDYRTSVDIDAPGGYEFSVCRLRMYGIEQQTMDRLSIIGYFPLGYMANSLRVEATDNQGVFSTIWLGQIYSAQPDYTGAPDVAFVVEARAGLIGSLAPTGATSFPGAQKVSLMMGQLASELGLTLENNGVESTLTDQYLSGTASQKIQRIADAARIQFWYMPEQGVLAIAPQGVARQGDPISYNFTNGLVGWPTKTHVGVMFTALFNPAIFHGSRILLESDVSACNGEWYIVSMSHRLDGETPRGAWFTHFVATPQNTTILRR